MDWVSLGERVRKLLGKYKYVVLVLAIGLFLMALPVSSGKAEPKAETPVPTQINPSEKLEEILSQIAGVGKVRVFLTEASGAETVYQTDKTESSSDTSNSLKTETVFFSDSTRAQTPLVKTVIPPVYMGAIVVCQGADSAAVRLAVVQAVANVTGLGSDRIAVLKMK